MRDWHLEPAGRLRQDDTTRELPPDLAGGKGVGIDAEDDVRTVQGRLRRV